MSNGDFFAVGTDQWAHTCSLGMNPAVAHLVLARGSGRDNATTRWGAKSVSTHTGMAWRRARKAIDRLDHSEAVAEVIGKGDKPNRKLSVPDDMADLIWLPNTLVTAAKSEVPPLAKLRQSQNLEHLKAFVELYGLHDLAGDGGLPRSLIWKNYDERDHICELGQFRVFGFRATTDTRTCNQQGPLKPFAGRKTEDGDSESWIFIRALENMGLLESVTYLAESDSPESELIHALSGDQYAEDTAAAAAELASELPGGFRYEAEAYDYVLPVPRHIATPAVVGVSRLTYRPHTKATSAWYARHVEACTRAAEQYHSLASGEYTIIKEVMAA